MKNQALFSPKDKSEKLKCRLLQFLFGTLRVKFLDLHRGTKRSLRKATVMSYRLWRPYERRMILTKQNSEWPLL